MLEELIPNSAYVRRSSHRWGHKFSVREIAKFGTRSHFRCMSLKTDYFALASNRNFTTMVVLMEDQKRYKILLPKTIYFARLTILGPQD